MSAAFDRLVDRTESLIAKVEAGESIDFEKEAKLDALDTVMAGIEYTEGAIQRTTEADMLSEQLMREEDERITG